jgi:DNA gyrase subunit A
VSEIRVTARNAQGVKLVALDDLDVVSAVARVIPDDKDDGLGGDELADGADVTENGDNEG